MIASDAACGTNPSALATCAASWLRLLGGRLSRCWICFLFGGTRAVASAGRRGSAWLRRTTRRSSLRV